MKLLNIEMQYQLGEFKNEIMTSPPYQKYVKGKLKGEFDPDYIYEYGCKITAFLNCFNLFNRGHKYMTLKELNDEIKKRNGYFYLHYMAEYNNISKAKDVCFGKESYVMKDVLHDILGIKSEIEISTTMKPYVDSLTDYYVCRTVFQKTGHYSMVYNSELKYLDSYDCKIKESDNILNLYKIIF